MLTLEAPQKFQYIECNKGEFHKGQMLNMVCVEPGCIDQAPCCCVCIEEDHKKHATMSIKKMLFHVHEKSQKVSGSNSQHKYNTDSFFSILDSQKKEAFEKFTLYKNAVKENIIAIENTLESYYGNIHSQLAKEKKSDINAAMQVLNGSYNVQDLNIWMKKLVTIELSSENLQPATEEQVQENIKKGHEQNMNTVIEKVNNMGKQLQDILVKMKEKTNEMNIWIAHQGFKFSPEFKAKNIQILNDTTVKSTSSDSYRFAIMTPHLESGEFKEFKFSMKNLSSSWAAVGVCHKDMIKQKGYAFNYSSTGHGAYMVSSNAGSWSNINSSHNNKVQAFNFYHGDTVTVQVYFKTKKIKFVLNDYDDTYELDFETIQADKLHPCALFYFNNDEIELLPQEQ